ncbi:MAG TPA: DUF1343 domain-containing protein [Thermoanaerobaculia bacterium]|nr:DUF1343 domain-containing protein [Thermoanaerobaculia bacterium]
MLTGLDSLLLDPTPIRGRRVGLVTNHACVTRNGIRNVDALLALGACELVAIFAPEHGYWADLPYMEEVPDEQFRGRIPIHSLYGMSRAMLSPRREQLANIDALVIDLQDVGARYYTYAATMFYCMRVAAECGIDVIVLDRPNPIGGRHVEGNLIEPAFESFVAAYPIANRHGMTMGELAMFLDAWFEVRCKLHVVTMIGWKRSMLFDDCALPWIYPSPNMAKMDTAIVYPGMCLLEGTNLSEGRGTTQPFEIFGAPFLDADALADTLSARELPGVRFAATRFTPSASKFRGQLCHGVQIVVTDRLTFQPVRTGVHCIQAAHDLAGGEFAWIEDEYEFANCLAIDTLAGCDTYRRVVETRGNLDAWVETWPEERAAFDRARKSVLFREYADAPLVTFSAELPAHRPADGTFAEA